VLLQALHQDLNIGLVVEPVLFVLLHLILGFTQLLVEFLDILLRVHELAVIGELFKIFSDCLIELTGFTDKYLLNCEQIPVLPYGLQQVIKEVIKFNTQVVPDEDYVVAQLHFVLSDTF
jgi:hypothetical protein